MAYEENPEHSGPEGSASVSQLEARVAQLERDLAELRRQINPSAATAEPMMRKGPAAPPPVPQAIFVAMSKASSAKEAPARTFRAVAPPVQTSESLENRLGAQIFNRIAIVLLLIGTAYGLKLAVDRDLIGPTGRVIAGLVAGAGLILWSERFRRKGFPAFSYSLKAVGSGVLYLSLWAALQLFHLLPASVALLLMVLVTAWNAYMAWAQNSELLAAYALIGGFATPLLLSTGGNHEIFLFTYLLAIDIATILLVRLKSWPRLLLGIFPVTLLFFAGWYGEFFITDELIVTSIFVLLFGITFASVSLGRNDKISRLRASVLEPVVAGILLPIANAIFVAFAMYSALNDSGHHALLPWLMVALSAAYLAMRTLPQTQIASAVHLSLAVVLLTIAVPLKASGHWITVSWLVEGLALLWIASRLETTDAEPKSDADSLASATLRWLGTAALLLGFSGVCFNVIDQLGTDARSLFNKTTGTALTGICIFAATVWLAQRAGSKHVPTRRSLAWDSIELTAFVLIPITALFLTLRELLSLLGSESLHPPFRTPDFLTALLGLAVLAAVIAISVGNITSHPDREFWMNSAVASTVGFNLIAVFTGVREISAIWSAAIVSQTVDAALRQALAISAFLMLYGAVLLAVGFWRHSGFLRWQALVLLIFTILKTFLYDMRSLSQGYRVASLLGLGVLLMAISYAYQRDWLGLREQASTMPPPVEREGTE